MISCSNNMQNKHPVMDEETKIKTLTIHFSWSRKYLADVFQFQQEDLQIQSSGKGVNVYVYMYVHVFWSHLNLIIYVVEKCIN